MSDLDQAVAAVRTDLVGSRFVSDARQSGSVLLRATPMTNLSLDRFTRAEERMVVSRVLSDSGVQVALREAGIRLLDPKHSLPDDATHEFRAEIRSLAREGAAGGAGGGRRREHNTRRDSYLLEYEIITRADREIVWHASTEVARAARGLVID